MTTETIQGRKLFTEIRYLDYINHIGVELVKRLMSSTWFITGHMTYNQAYTYKFQLKTTLLALKIYWRPHKLNMFLIGHYNWTQFFCLQDNVQVNLHQITIFPCTVSVETILFWKWKIWKFSYSFCIMAIFYFQPIEGGNYSSEEETICGNIVVKLEKYGWTSSFCRTWENMLCTKIVLNVRNNFYTQHSLSRFELGIFMY